MTSRNLVKPSIYLCSRLPLALEADELGEAKLWVDASFFATHHDMRSHAGELCLCERELNMHH